MSRGKVGGTDGAVLERSKPAEDLKASKEKALCVELREILKEWEFDLDKEVNRQITEATQ